MINARGWVVLGLELAAALLLAGCPEPASTYDPSRGIFVSTRDYKKEHEVDEQAQPNTEIGSLHRSWEEQRDLDQSGRYRYE